MKNQLIIISLLISLFHGCTFAFSESKAVFLGKTNSELVSILDYKVNENATYTIYGIDGDNNLIKEVIYFTCNNPINRSSIIYSFDKSIKTQQIALKDSKIAFIKDSILFSVNLNSDVFIEKKYTDETMKKSDIYLIKIIDNSIQLFCKQNKNDYFIYKITGNKKERIDFNFSPGTVINNFKIENDCYLVSGFIRDPFLNDQYAYFTQTELNGKMIWEKQEGKSDAISIGYDLQIKNGYKKMLYSINGKIRLNSDRYKEITEPSFARVSNDLAGNNIFIVSGNNNLYFYSDDYSKGFHLQMKKIEVKGDSINRNPIALIQDEKYPFLYITQESYKKDDGFQLEVSNTKDYDVNVISFSGNKKIDKFKSKVELNYDEYLLLPSKNTQFEKNDNNDEYLLLIYSKKKNDFLDLKKWDVETLENVLMYLSFNTMDYRYNIKKGLNELNSSVIVDVKNREYSLIPVLFKVKGTKK